VTMIKQRRGSLLLATSACSDQAGPSKQRSCAVPWRIYLIRAVIYMFTLLQLKNMSLFLFTGQLITKHTTETGPIAPSPRSPVYAAGVHGRGGGGDGGEGDAGVIAAGLR